MKWETFINAKEGRPKLKRAMLRWKVADLHEKSIQIWPPTPDPSPQPSPAVPSWDSDAETVMSTEETLPSRPKSIISQRSGAHLSSRPLLADVLANRSAPPYTLSAFTAFLSQNHCLETLEFVLAARRYQQKYDELAATLAGFPMTFDHDEVRELQKDWRRLIDVYLSPGGFREINLPSEERDELLHVQYTVRPPPPEVLEPSIKRMHDLMQESIWMPFLNQYANSIPTVHTYTAPSPNPNEGLWAEPSRTFADGRRLSVGGSRKKHSPTPSNDTVVPHSSPPVGHRPLSTLTSAIHKSKAGDPRLSQQVSNTSVGSSTREYALTDDSGSVSPGLTESTDPMTPPTTPPSSDIGLGIHHTGHSPKGRSDSGAWKRMGQKFGWNKKNRPGGPHLHPPDEEDHQTS